jgi:hypothetical protein
MFSGVSGSGFLSFFPPTVTLCLIRVIAEVSHFPGGVTLHPERQMAKSTSAQVGIFM